MSNDKYWDTSDAMEAPAFDEPGDDWSDTPTATDPLRTLTALALCELLGWPRSDGE